MPESRSRWGILAPMLAAPAEGHELPASDGEVGVAGVFLVAPAALIVGAFADILGVEDEADGRG